MALIIDATTGTILDMDDCYIVEDASLTKDEEAMLDSGSDSLIGELAMSVGIPLNAEALEWVKYGRTTSISYGPSALRDEAEVLLEVMGEETDGDDPEDVRMRGLLRWAHDDATDSELAYIAQHILGDDHAWDGYRENFRYSLDWYANGHEPF